LTLGTKCDTQDLWGIGDKTHQGLAIRSHILKSSKNLLKSVQASDARLFRATAPYQDFRSFKDSLCKNSRVSDARIFKAFDPSKTQPPEKSSLLRSPLPVHIAFIRWSLLMIHFFPAVRIL
jgi:hypothetical protein